MPSPTKTVTTTKKTAKVFDPKTGTVKDLVEVEQSELPLAEQEKQLFIDYSLKYCISLYYWMKTGRCLQGGDEILTEEQLMDYHYFCLQYDNQRQNLFWKTLGKMLGGGKKK